MRKAIARVCKKFPQVIIKKFLTRGVIFIFIVGDFGLATSSLAAVDPSDVSPHAVTLEADMTLGILSLFLKFPLFLTTFYIKRLVLVCTLHLKYNQGNEGQEIIRKLTCTVWVCVFFRVS